MGADVVVNEKGEVLRYGVAHAMLVNNDTGETAEFIINPSELKYSLSVGYKKPSPIMRAPEGPLQYEKTSTKEYTVEAFADRELFPDRDMMDWLAFLESLCYPVRSGAVVSGPPDVLFVWPGILAMPCRITKLDPSFDEFDQDLHPKSLKVSLTLEETGETIRWSDEERTRIVITEGF